jgi:hypothetical protein
LTESWVLFWGVDDGRVSESISSFSVVSEKNNSEIIIVVVNPYFLRSGDIDPC